MNTTSSFPFKAALNTSTLAPFGLGVLEQVTIAAEAGYEGIELWMRDIDAYLSAGGSLPSLRRHIEESGVSVVNAIAFFKWADASEAVREEALDQASREMRVLAAIGCRAVAAPPFGEVAEVALDEMALYFRRLSDAARAIGVEPYLEFWGRAKRLSRASEAVYVAMESGVPDAKMLFDVFHMYTGGSEMAGLGLLKASSIGIVHVNDYPASPSRATITDADRVFPGDGGAPCGALAKLLVEAGYDGYLSLELFIQDFGARAALDVAREGLEKVRRAFTLSAEMGEFGK